MSNELAIATVTAALGQALSDAFAQDQLGFPATVTHVRPNAADKLLPTTGANIFLFLVTPNAANRNADLPVRYGATGALVHAPTVALDLHYLISFYGDDAQLEPEILLGSTVRMLHESPDLSSAIIHEVLQTRQYQYLAGSDLANELEPVRFSPSGMSLDELSKLWSVVFQTPYVLSVVYQASYVRIRREQAVVATLPVRQLPNLVALPTQPPTIARILSQVTVGGQVQLSPAPPFTGGKIVLRGQNLSAPNTAIEIDGNDVTASVNAVFANTKIQLTLPANMPSGSPLLAGAHTLQIVRGVDFKFPPDEPNRPGGPSVLRTGVVQSNAAPFVLQPQVTAANVDGSAPTKTVTVNVTPSIGRQQRLRLLLNQLAPAAGATAGSYSIVVPPRLGTGADAALTISIAGQGVSAGTYLVRVEVDGIASAQPPDAAGGYWTPTVAIQ